MTDQAPIADVWWPDLIHRHLTGYQTSAIIRTVLDLDLFSAFRGAPLQLEDLAVHCSANRRGMRILCDTLTVLGLLRKADDLYMPAPGVTALLDSRSPNYIGGSILFWLAPEIVERWENLTAYVRNGGSTDEGTIKANNPLWVQFASGMGPSRALQADILAKTIVAQAPPRRILDIGTGHGAFAIAMARHAPEAEVTINDWSAVAEITMRHAASAGVADQFRVLDGDALAIEYGNQFDVVVFANFLHHFDKSTCQFLLGKAADALVRDGRVCVVDFMPNEDRISPYSAALCSITMLVETPRGEAHTSVEIKRMIDAAGFSRIECRELQPSPHRVVIGFKP